MAKKINTEEKPPVTTDDTQQGGPVNTTETVNGTEPVHAETAPPAKPEEREHAEARMPDAFASELLKKFPGYPSLYIDAHGGTFSPDTPAAIRGKAVLYENPFYNQLKDQS
ncbi:hypothetical protein K020075H21_04490 [Bacteroides ovatus]|uniref:hypothetical protein n=1 Tax=Bacteroides ovatus TaxID=28116 RepID=UPI0034BC5D65